MTARETEPAPDSAAWTPSAAVVGRAPPRTMLQRLRRRVAPDGTLRRDLVRLVFFDLPAWSAAGARGILPALAALRRTAQREWLPLAAAAPARFVAMLCAPAGLREPLNDHAYELARFPRA
ncbi:MAG TPA: hypothetical protein PKC49_12585, partial [Phycisphaerae bacterium]|nr:hypothetical protein [Phycisphaerae bacterium]